MLKNHYYLCLFFALLPFAGSCDNQLLAYAAEPSPGFLYSTVQNYTPAPAENQKDLFLPNASLLTMTSVQHELQPQNFAAITGHLASSTVIGGVQGAKSRLTNVGMPRNTRQAAEGYWIGARPTLKQLEELHARNINLILTAASIEPEDYSELSMRMRELGMTHINVPFGGRFPNSDKFLQKVQQFPPDQVYIHCEHGGDRSGAILAYLLIVNHGWSIPRALLSVAFPGKMDSNALVAILNQRGYEVTEQDLEEVLGIYSGESNGGYGGLKVRSDGYVKLINTTIDAARKQLKKNEMMLVQRQTQFNTVSAHNSLSTTNN